MHKATFETTRLIHENFWIVLSFALARPAVEDAVNTHFRGEWKYLNKSIYELAEVRADRALLEMATQLRVLDDAQDLNGYYKQTQREAIGSVRQSDGTVTPLYFRDMTNKIMHADNFEWHLCSGEPTIVCHPKDASRWERAEISLIALMALVGGLVF